jgi:hypothetical protein
VYAVEQQTIDELGGRLLFLAWAGVLAALSAGARYLMENRGFEPLPFLGGLMGSALAAFSFAGLMIEAFNVSNLLVLAMAGPIGWVGGDVLAALGRKILREAGVESKKGA